MAQEGKEKRCLPRGPPLPSASLPSASLPSAPLPSPPLPSPPLPYTRAHPTIPGAPSSSFLRIQVLLLEWVGWPNATRNSSCSVAGRRRAGRRVGGSQRQARRQSCRIACTPWPCRRAAPARGVELGAPTLEQASNWPARGRPTQPSRAVPTCSSRWPLRETARAARLARDVASAPSSRSLAAPLSSTVWRSRWWYA